MVDMLMLQGAVNGLKMAGDIAKGFLKLTSLAEVQGLTIELQSTILAAQTSALAAQSEQFTLVQRVRDLEEEIASVKAWEEEKKRYQLVSPWNGANFFVYALKESSKGTEPPHWICTKCYDDGRRTIPNPTKDSVGFIHLSCPTCKADIHSGMRALPPATYIQG